MATIPLPVSHSVIDTAQWGIPITNEVNRLTGRDTTNTPTAWANLTLQNGWVNYQLNCQYRKIGDMVYLRGCANGGTNNTVMFTVPVGFRPPVRVNSIAYHWPSAPGACFMLVNPDGTTLPAMLNNAVGNPQYVDLGQLYWSLT